MYTEFTIRLYLPRLLTGTFISDGTDYSSIFSLFCTVYNPLWQDILIYKICFTAMDWHYAPEELNHSVLKFFSGMLIVQAPWETFAWTIDREKAFERFLPISYMLKLCEVYSNWANLLH